MRFIIFTLSILALLIVAAVAGPSFVDWNKYKPQIIEQVKNATGLDVQVGGDLSLAILPSPRVKIEDLVVVSPKKIQFENLLSMKSAEVSVALLPLLKKQVQVSSVTLIEPDIQIEILEDGTPSWTTDKIAKAKEVSNVTPEDIKTDVNVAATDALESIALNKLEIEKGKIAFVNHQTKASYAVSDVNMVLKADSLRGPFDVEGSLVYDAKKIEIDAQTGKLPTANEALSIQAKLALPDADTSVSFGGVAAIKAPYDAQGQTTIKVESPAKLAQLFGASSGVDEAFMLDGLLSASEDKISYNDLKVSLGNFVGNGKISVQNFKEKNPVRVSGAIKSSSVLDIDQFLDKTKNVNTKSESEGLKSAGKKTAKSSALVPQTLTLPMPINVDVKVDIAGVKVKNQNIKGVFVDVQKNDKTSKINFKALELPGQGKVDGALTVSFGSSSTTPKTGQVTYSDPSVTYQVNGQTGQIKTFLKAFAPDADTSAVTNLYKTAQFNLKGAVNSNAVSLKDSTLKLDQFVVGLGGRYQPATGNGRAKAIIDISAGAVDFDKILASKGGNKSSGGNAGGKSSGGSKGSAKDALKPLENFSLPVDLTFDVSLQKARINNADLEGLRLTGDLIGQRLNLKTASVNNFAGAAMSVKGQVANISKLSGLDLAIYTKTSDVQKLASALKVDTAKFPAGLKAVEANVSAKGAVEKLAFTSNIKALGGQLDANGNATNLLEKPNFDNLSIGLKHPNMVKAIQIVSPSFKGQAGLNQAIDFYTKASTSGKTYTLSDMKVSIGETNFGGNLKIDAGSKIPAISGDIKAGKIALDSLLGAKSTAKSSGSSSASPSGGASSSKERWSKAPIDLSFMNNVNVNVGLSAASISYGAWNFTQPSTSLKIANGQLNVNGMKAGVFGGQANLTTEVKANPLSLTLSNSMSNIDLEALAKALTGGNKLKSAGTVSFNMDIASNGGSAFALINALGGSAKLDGTNVTLKGFDLAKLARGLAVEEKLATSVTSLIDGATRGGETKFDTVKGDYKITNGVVNITSMVMDSSDAVIKSTGSADLPKWFINVDNVITLKSVPDLKPFEVKIKGPIDKPGNTFGKNILEDYLTDKIKRKIEKELGDKLPDILGDDVTNALEGFGILPKKQAPTPTPVPSPTEGSAPAEQPAAPTPAPQQAPAANPLDRILQGDNPEDAVKDVLKGLF